MKIDVSEDFAGQRIDKFLSSVERIGSRARAEKLLEAGLVLVHGAPAIKSLKVRTGDVVEVPDTELAEPAPRTYEGTAPVDVLFEDDDVLVVDKPAGLVVHPAPGHRALTLVELLTGGGMQLAENDDEVHFRPGVVHRLDKNTSGAMMLAKNHAAQRALQLALRERTAKREYLALVNGHVPSRAGRIEAAIGRDVRDSSRRSIETDFPQDAITHFVVQELLPTTTLLRLKLETGRTHQIRVHMESIGHNVVADSVYGTAPQFGLDRQFLHAAKLTFPHPRTGEPIEVASPLPEDLHVALGEARRAQPDD
ncbi:MAG: pseudouridine synthase, RluA family [Thermoleophilia bacterium]|jgi:23S rRNA pseudouridine1911/1915/1917 synthase|nr:pseudouridine synthase, RluA family [Thermoleophilia bacterium]